MVGLSTSLLEAAKYSAKSLFCFVFHQPCVSSCHSTSWKTAFGAINYYLTSLTNVL